MRPLIVLFLCLHPLWAASQSGVVRAGGVPIPGATVTALSGDQKLVTTTDENGQYTFENLAPGAWKFEVRMFGFAPATKDLSADQTAAKLEWNLEVQPFAAQRRGPFGAGRGGMGPGGGARPGMSEGPANQGARRPGGSENAAARGPRPATPAGGRGTLPGQQGTTQAGGFQSLELTAENTAGNTIGTPAVPAEVAADSGSESFLVNGSLSRGLQAPQDVDQFGAGGRPDFGGRGEFGGPNGQLGGDGGAAPGFGAGNGGGPGGGGGGFGGGGFGGGGRGGFGGRGGPGGPGRAPMNAEQREAFRRRMEERRRNGGEAAYNFGNRRRNNANAWRGMASYQFSGSTLDARPFSLTGQAIEKPSYSASRFGISFGGPLKIPKLLTSGRTFLFLNYSGTVSDSPYNAVATVPNLLERAGDFSQSTIRGPVTIYDPISRLPFAGNRIPASRIDPVALGLLPYIPLPNLPGTVQNYQFVTSIPRNTENINARISHTLTQKDRLSLNLNGQWRSGENAQVFGYVDDSSGTGFSADTGWAHTFGAQTIHNLRFNYNRNRNETLPYFAYGENVAAQLGILGVGATPIGYGPPNLNFTNFGDLTDASPLGRNNQSYGIQESMSVVRGSHTIGYGIGLRRVMLDTNNYQNVRGTYTLTGLATSGFDAQGLPLPNTGFDFADFLLSAPQSSTVRYSSTDTYFRTWDYSGYFQDDWRARSNLTVNVGLRYEYFAPFHESNGHLANLDIAPNFTGVAVVTPGSVGPYTGAFSSGLIDPDINNLSPRVGVAWRPMAKSHLQLRGGYGIYYDGSIYNNLPVRLAAQPPFASTVTLNTSLAQPLTLETGFTGNGTKDITNTYAIDRGYRTGYAQTWNFSVQQELPLGLTIEAGYLGTKGTRLDTLRLPNRAAPGSPLTAEERRQIGNAVGFTYESSEGNSIFHAAQIRVMRRMRRGVSFNMLYTFSKSIDNASVVGGSGGTGVVAQNDRDLSAERGLSAFDQRHVLNLNSFVNSPFGESGAWLRGNSFAAKLLKDWNISGGLTFRSGTPFTARVLGNTADAGGTGAVGTARADSTGLPVDGGTGYFNIAAFTVPPAGRYGDAARNTIPGIPFVSLNASIGRSFRMGSERRRLELRAQSDNVTNHVNITSIGTVVNASNFGLATAAGAMRTMSLQVRYRF